MTTIDSLIQNLGNRYLSFSASLLDLKRQSIKTQQEHNFKKIKRNLQGTRLYNDYRLAHINSYEDYVNHVPAHPFEEYSPYVDMIVSGHKNILFKDEITYFGLTSGTSGQDSKRIPYNNRSIRCFLNSQKQVASRLCHLEPGINLMASQRLTFGSDPLVYSQNGFKFGYISGILSTKTPKILLENTFPSKEVLSITNWDRKIEMLINETVDKDIRLVSGIPTYIISIFEAVLQKTGKTSIKEIWPNLQIFVYAATPIKPYKERIDKLVGHEVRYYGLYAATEAAIGLPYSRYENGRQYYFLNPELVYSLTTVEEPHLTLGLHEMELDRPYYLNVGLPNGFIHYAMKDVVKFNEINKELVFEFVGRKSTGMNLAAEKVTDEQILDCILKTKKELNIDIRHYFLSPTISHGKPAYHWTLFIPEKVIIDAPRLSIALDQWLQKINLDYKDCREVGVLAPAELKIVQAEHLKSYFEKNRSRGQFKMKTTFETAEDYAEYLKNQFEGVLQ